MGKQKSALFWICLLSTMAAVGTHIYLTNHHYSFKFGENVQENICNINSTVNCNRTTASQYSEVFGIPVAIFGGLINFFLLGLLLAFKFPVVARSTQEKLAGPIRLISLGILVTSLVMGFLSYVVLKTVCPACTVAYVLSLITFITAFMMTKGRPWHTPLDFKVYPVMVGFVAILAFIIHSNKVRSYGGTERLEMTELQFNQWKQTPQASIEPIGTPNKKANPNAKMHMVEYADFLCPHCATAYPVIHNFVISHPDVEFNFQAFPLDGECNSAIGYSEGTRCLLARVSYCATEQGLAWKTQSWIFENQSNLMSKSKVKEELEENVEKLGLDNEKLQTCLESEETKKIIRQQAKQGQDAGVKGTPSLFVNGRKIPGGITIPILEKIYQHLN